MVTRLRQLTALHAQQRNQPLLVTDKVVLKSFPPLLALLKTQRPDLELAIAHLIATDALWPQLDQSFRSIKGGCGSYRCPADGRDARDRHGLQQKDF